MIPYLVLTFCQQGGIGYPPVLIRLDKWYAVSDSRDRKYPIEIAPLLWYQRSYPKRDKYFHDQKWVYNKWLSSPQLTWDEVVKKVGL